MAAPPRNTPTYHQSSSQNPNNRQPFQSSIGQAYFYNATSCQDIWTGCFCYYVRLALSSWGSRRILNKENPILIQIFHILPSGAYILTSGNYILASGNYILASGNYILASGNYILASGSYILASGNHILASGNHILASVFNILLSHTTLSSHTIHTKKIPRKLGGFNIYKNWSYASFKGLCSPGWSLPSGFTWLSGLGFGAGLSGLGNNTFLESFIFLRSS